MEFSLNQLSEIAQNIIAKAANRASPDHATVIGFSGDLGAGKTTLIKQIAKELGVGDDLASPTFVIYKNYKIQTLNQNVQNPLLLGGVAAGRGGMTWKNLIHGDMYRLESPDEILHLGWEPLIADPENLIMVEWPEKIAGVMPEWAGYVTLSHTEGGDKRVLDFK